MSNMRQTRLLFLIVFSLAACKPNQNSSKASQYGRLDPKRLVVSKDDWSVQMALRNDSLYMDTEKYLMEDEKKSLKEAEEQIQSMIDNKLVVPPILFYYKEPGVVETKTLTYVEFKRYIEIVKDSVRNQVEREMKRK